MSVLRFAGEQKRIELALAAALVRLRMRATILGEPQEGHLAVVTSATCRTMAASKADLTSQSGTDGDMLIVFLNSFEVGERYVILDAVKTLRCQVALIGPLPRLTAHSPSELRLGLDGGWSFYETAWSVAKSWDLGAIERWVGVP